MGLDQYLYKKTYIGANYDHREVKAKVEIEIEGKKVNVNPKRLSYIVEQVGYWRKANQIHRWFVENIQKGKDDCGEYYVSVEQLKELMFLCKSVRDIKEMKSALLPTQDGFFFGSTDYDGYYEHDINSTIEIIEQILIEEENSEAPSDYYYQSSW